VRLHEGLTRARRPAWDCGAALAAPADVHDVPRERSGGVNRTGRVPIARPGPRKPTPRENAGRPVTGACELLCACHTRRTRAHHGDLLAGAGLGEHGLDQAFFEGTDWGKTWRSRFLCNLGYPGEGGTRPRDPRFDFDEACRIL